MSGLIIAWFLGVLICLKTIKLPHKFLPDKYWQTVPCGTCPECLTKRSIEWAQRCQHEMSLNPMNNSFVTLTYDDAKHSRYSFDYSDFQLFLKRLRKKYAKIPIRFIASREYGGKHGRLHFHSILFNFTPRNFDSAGKEIPLKEIKKTDRGFPIFYSSELDSLWGNGFISVAPATVQTAYYIASYALSDNVFIDRNGEILSDRFYCSKRPGIGFEYFLKYRKSLVHKAVTDNISLPRFYAKKLEEFFPSEYIYYKNELAKNAVRSNGDEYARLCEIISLQKSFDFRQKKNLELMKVQLSEFHFSKYLRNRLA